MRKSKTNCYRPKGKGRKTLKKIALFLQKIPHDKFNALTIEEKYCFLTLGHVHDEISWLQRMAYIASKSDTKGHDLEMSGKMMQATFLARLLLGKLFEFKVVMGSSESIISKFITIYYCPSDKSTGSAQVKTISDYYLEEKWIRTARNKHFLHYPSLSDVQETLKDPNIEWLPEIAHGKISSNTFYPTSDVMANYAWLKLENPKEPMKGLNEALGTIRELALLTIKTLEQSIGYFVDDKLLKLSENHEIKLSAESIYEIKLNYFVST